MERPFKRPRLSMFRDFHSPDEGLEIARGRNDHRLKSRFESIFAKYERDFTDVADEIDLTTGEILVDNGHLASMQGEKDVGLSHQSRSRSYGSQDSEERHYDGGRILRAMTVAPHFDGPRDSIEEGDDDDDVIMLFEKLAKDATAESTIPEHFIKMERDLSEENDLGPEISPVDGEHPVSQQDSDYDSLLDESEHLSRVGSPDSLLDDEESRGRSTSIDSLLDEDQHSRRSASQDSLLESQRKHTVGRSREESRRTSYDSNDEEAIIEQYGPDVGAQVLEVLRQRKAAEEAKVEPAWRLPDIGPSFEKAGVVTNHSYSSIPSSPQPLRLQTDISSPEDNSIWRPVIRRKRRPKIAPPPRRRDSAASAATDDSEDPLQADFPDPIVQEDIADHWQEYLDNKICPYCKRHRLHLTQHFNLIVEKGPDGIHDVKNLTRYCKSRRIGEVTIRFFLDIVQYKELDNMGFLDIAKQLDSPLKVVYNLYYQYRAIQMSDEELAAEGLSWTKEEDERMTAAAKAEDATFRSVKHIMGGRKIAQIGNRLATLHMRSLEEQGIRASQALRKDSVEEVDAHDRKRRRVSDEDFSDDDDLLKAASVYTISDDDNDDDSLFEAGLK